MGYYAKGNGSITFSGEMSKEKLESIRAVLIKEYETDAIIFNGDTSFDLWSDGKYYETEVDSVLREITKFGKIKSGEVDYIGEDDSVWRFKHKQYPFGEYGNGTWVEQKGQIVYYSDDGTIDES